MMRLKCDDTNYFHMKLDLSSPKFGEKFSVGVLKE